MMVGSNLNDIQLQQIVDKTVLEADQVRALSVSLHRCLTHVLQDKDGKISFDEFVKVHISHSLGRNMCSFAQMINNTDEIDQKLTFSLDQQ